MPRTLVKSLITESLGYCCEYFFFTRYPNAGLVAARLGISLAAAKDHKSRVVHGGETCRKCKGCFLLRYPNVKASSDSRPVRAASNTPAKRDL